MSRNRSRRNRQRMRALFGWPHYYRVYLGDCPGIGSFARMVLPDGNVIELRQESFGGAANLMMPGRWQDDGNVFGIPVKRQRP
jgi:allantoicase